jgi:hypothetical protein
MDMDVTDFRNSFILTAGPTNSVKFVAESCCKIFDEKADTVNEFIQCASCKSENTFSPEAIFTDNNYNFTPVFGTDMTTAIFSEYIIHNDGYLRVGDMSDGPLTVWGKPSFHLRKADEFETLETAPALIAAVRAGKHIVIQTEFVVAERGIRVILEYPAKTINMNEEVSAIQVDTGPIVFPDFSVTHDRHIDALRLCYLTFNNSGRCEVIVQDSINAVKYSNPKFFKYSDMKSSVNESLLIDHYCDIRSLDASHRIYSLQ